MSDNSQQTTLNASASTKGTLEGIDWTFEGANTSYLTHGLHAYPARMIPQIPDALFEYYLSEDIIAHGDTVYDPFSGSGTTAVEARLHGLHAEANDINPLACLISRTKAIPLDPRRLNEARGVLLDNLADELDEIKDTFETGDTTFEDGPDVRDGWFPEPQLRQLWHTRRRIDGLEDEFDESVARFFRIVLSDTCREISYQRNGEFKRYRMAEEDRKTHDPDVLKHFIPKLETNLGLMRDYSEQVDDTLRTTVHYADSRSATTNEDAVEANTADIVITSPPYGDHRTTVAYGQYSQDPAIIVGDHGYDEMKSVDKTGLGGKNSTLDQMSELEEWSSSFGATMDALRDADGRSDDAMTFIRDYYEVMKEVAKILKPGQPAAWVVANRTMSRVNVPTHLITQELCEHIGYDHEITLPREIPTKTLPWENAPENTPGVKGDLMANENIVVMRSPN